MAALVLLAALLTPAPASACSPVDCYPGVLLPSSGSLPQNGAAYFEPSPGHPVVSTRTGRAHGHLQPPAAIERLLRVFRLTANGDVPVPFEMETVDRPGAARVPGERLGTGYLVRPTAGWIRGADYRIEASPGCDAQPAMTGTFRVTRRAPLPRALGRLEWTPGEGMLGVRTWRGTCSERIFARWADVRVRLHASARPWRDVLFYWTDLDDERWLPSASLGAGGVPGRSWVGRAADRVYVGCPVEPSAADRGAPPGAHAVRIFAAVPGGGGASLSTRPAPFDVTCDPLPSAPPGDR